MFTHLLSDLVESRQAQIVDNSSAPNKQGSRLGRQQSKVLAGRDVALKGRSRGLLGHICGPTVSKKVPILVDSGVIQSNLKVFCHAASHHE